MGSFSGLGIGLSFLFGCILLGLVAELYYVLWWKKRFTNTDIQNHYAKHAPELSHLFCWKTPNSQNTNSSITKPQNPIPDVDEQDPEMGRGRDLLLKGLVEEGVESELMRLHNLCGPPRFLFTIKEETKEDLESADGKSRRGSRTRSLSDLIMSADTPFLTPLPSPKLMGQPLDSYNNHGFNFNPLFESSTDNEMYRLRSSPPPKFKFLRDAEEKLMRRLVEEAERRVLKNGGSVQDSAIKAPSTPSQVLPLASSPSTFSPIDK